MKYPRTYHLPFSPGTTNDDKMLPKKKWFDNYRGKEVVITEKLDGENIHMDKDNCFARSDGEVTRSPWTKNIWSPSNGLFWRVQHLIGSDETIFGENLYGEHAIHYDKLNTYFHIFGVVGKSKENPQSSIFYSWDDLKKVSERLEIPTVPVIYEGKIQSEAHLKKIIEEAMKTPSAYGTTKEGIVMRIRDSFLTEDFPKCVCKWVRPNHVQTDKHWTKNWKRAELFDNYEYY
ncbi:hypothetical protein H8356DRAFT_603350 [Neocallimastix lanati (nom. inval.)]|uniref:RNA ligase domain-containing protein n=1 Tax=Neocallimastix californiae TaxID=1754190 RepID=A0A1Y2DMG4_9FUNG|nr:hypothetical protein H8356DRAFT_603350 [Neocallimastix sp. JGI-2020a]ORY60326.1 hypothetical protein LY90DRAFT_243930 [Neocallimastix californiae]|eukprot:ORY60326.1 hypothetical protein LY90DRAFT_243930 [Neocallimastix californiae]